MKTFYDGHMTGININALDLIAMSPTKTVKTSIPGVICIGYQTIVVDKALKNDVFPVTDAQIEKKQTLKEKVLSYLKK